MRCLQDVYKRQTYEVLKAQLDRYPDLQNDIAFLADYSSFSKNVDFAGRMVCLLYTSGATGQIGSELTMELLKRYGNTNVLEMCIRDRLLTM